MQVFVASAVLVKQLYKTCAFSFLTLQFSLCLQRQRDEEYGEHPVEFAGGNVSLVTTKDIWDQKMSEASRDGKIVSYPSTYFQARERAFVYAVWEFDNHVEWPALVCFDQTGS